MEIWICLAVFAAVLIGIGLICLAVRLRIRRFSRQVFGTASLLKGLKAVDTAHLEEQRSLNGCDSLLLPRILQDFPDFDPNLAKTYAREYLKTQLAHNQGLTIHRIVFSQYLRSLAQKTIVMQAALCWKQDGQTRQMRYELDYTYLLNDADPSVAANCPNCGGALGFGVTQCSYCGSRVANALGNRWQFTAMRQT